MNSQPLQNQSNTNQAQQDNSKNTKSKIAKFPDWDILPKSQFINPRVKKN
jgi:hypothetical protein